MRGNRDTAHRLEMDWNAKLKNLDITFWAGEKYDFKIEDQVTEVKH